MKWPASPLSVVSFRRVAIFCLPLLALAGNAGCQATANSESGTTTAEITLAENFDTSLISGLKLVLDGAGGAALDLAASAEQEMTVANYRFTMQVKNDDTDLANEVVVLFSTNPFTGRSFRFVFRGNWGASVPIAIRATVLVQGGKQETAAVEVTSDNSPITLEKGKAQTVPIAVACTEGASCIGTIPPPVLTGSVPGSPANNNAPKIRGQTVPDVTVKIYTNADCTSDVAGQGTGADLATSGIAVTVLDDSKTTFYAKAFNALANYSPCSTTSVTFVEDSTAPLAPTVNAETDPPSPGKTLTPRVSGTAEADASVLVFTSASCTGNAAATGAADAFADGGIAATVTNNDTTSFSVAAVDTAGNQSPCAIGPSYTADNATNAPTLTSVSPPSPANNNAPLFAGTAEVGSTVSLFVSAACTGQPVATGSAAAFTDAGIAVAVNDDTTTIVYAQAVDALGNASGCSTGLTFIEDSLPPATPTGLSTSPSSPANLNTPYVIGSAPGAALVEVSVVSCGGAVAVSGTAAAFATTGLQIPVATIADNTTTSISVRAKDAAGNASACATISYLEDSATPQVPTITSTLPTSPANLNPPNKINVIGSAPDSTTVLVYTSPDCLSAVTSASRAVFESTGIEVAVSADSTATLYARATDGANTSACSPVFYFTEDSTSPIAPTGLSVNPTSPSSSNTPKIIGAAENGSTVEIYATSNCTGTIAATGTAANFASPGLTVNVASNTTTTFYARAVDGAGNAGPCTATGVAYQEDSVDPVAPTDLTTSPASPANNNYPVVKGTAEPGTTVRIHATSDCSDAPQSTGTADVFNSSGISASVGNDTTTTFYARAIDSAGNLGPCSSTGVQFREDSTAPDPPTVSSVSPAALANNNVPLIIGTAEANSTVRIYKTIDCSSTVAGQDSAATFASTGIQVNVTDNTQTTFYARAVDQAGNVSGCSSTSVTYTEDSDPPGQPLITATSPTSPANLSPPNTVTFIGQAPNATSVSLFSDEACITQIATGTKAVFESTGIPFTVTADATTTVYAKSTDGANWSSCSPSFSFTEDGTAPDAPAGLSTSPASPANFNTPYVIGTATGATTVEVSLVSCDGAIAVQGTAAAFASPGLQIPVSTIADDSSTTIYVRAKDAAGNTSTCATINYIEDSTTPQVPSITSTSPASPANLTPPNTVSVIGSAPDAVTVLVYTSPDCASAVASGTRAVFESTGIEIVVTADSTATIYAKASDGANTSACSPVRLFTEDSLVPAAPSGLSVSPPSPSSTNTPKVIGSAELGSTVEIYTTSNCTGTIAASGTAAAFASPGLTVTVADDSTTTFYARAVDGAGNAGPCASPGVAYQEDSVDPIAPANLSTTPASPANNNYPLVKGNAEPGTTVHIYATSNCSDAVQGTGTADVFNSTGISVTVADESTTTFYARSTDSAGNLSPCSAGVQYREDSTAPGAPAVSSVLPGPLANNNTPLIIGSAETGATVKLYKTPDCSSTVAGQDTAAVFASTGIQVNVTDNSVTTIYAQAVDSAGNVSACSSTSVTYTEDSASPDQPLITTTSPPGPADLAAPNNTVAFIGQAPGATSVSLYSDPACITLLATGTKAAFESTGIPYNVSENTTTTVYAKSTDGANTSICSPAFSFTEDSNDPAAPTGLSTSPASPANDTYPEVRGTAEPGTTVEIFTNASCTPPNVKSGTAADFASPGLTVNVTDNTTTTFYAQAIDGAGNRSACSTASIVFTADSQVPDAPTGLDVNPASPANYNSPKIKGATAETGSTVEIYGTSNCTATLFASGPAATFLGDGLTVVVTDNTTTTFYARAIDQAGNAGACSTSSVTFTENSSAPPVPTITATTPPSPRNLTPPNGITVKGTATGAEVVHLYTDSSCVTSLADAGKSIFEDAGIPFFVATDLTTTIWAKSQDVSGNYSGCSQPFNFVEDSTAPSAPLMALTTNPPSPRNDNAPKVFGTAETNSTVYIYADAGCGGVPAGSGSAAVFGSPGVPVSVANNTTTVFYGLAVDQAGNDGGCSPVGVSYTEDSTAPNIPTLTFITASPANNNNPVIKGTADSNTTVRIYAELGCTGAIQASGAAADFPNGFNLTIPDNTTKTYYALAEDQAGNVGPCTSTGLSFTEDSAGPAGPTGLTVSPASPANNNWPYVRGTAEANSMVAIYTNSGCTGASSWGGSATTFASSGIQVNVADNTVTTFWAKATDSSNNPGSCSTASVEFREDSVPPVDAGAFSTSPWPVANNNNPVMKGVAEAQTGVTIFTNASCSGASVGSGSAAAFHWDGGAGVTLALTDDTSYTLYAKSADDAGNSSCSKESILYREDSTSNPPTAFSWIPDGGNNSDGGANNNVPLLAGQAENLARVEVLTGSCTGTLQVAGSAATFASTGLQIPGGVVITDNSDTTFYVKAIDDAGNVSSCATFTYFEDSLAPTFGGAGAALYTTNTTDSLTLSWDAGVDNRTPVAQLVYDVCESTTYGSCQTSFATTFTTSAGATSYLRTGLDAGLRYSYVARPRDRAGNQNTSTVQVDGKTGSIRATVKVATSQGEQYALESDGMMPARSLPSVVDIAAGGTSYYGYFGCAVISDGTARCWGKNDYGQVGDGTFGEHYSPVVVTGAIGLVAVSTGNTHTCGLHASGEVSCWGNNASGQLGDDGGAGAMSAIPVRVLDVSNAIQVSAGGDTSCAVRRDGRAVCWGRNNSYNFGDGTATSRKTATPVLDGGVFKSISVSWAHTCGTLADGTGKCWGSQYNSYGQLGNGDTLVRSTPAPITVSAGGAPLTGIIEIITTRDWSCARMSTRNLSCWGYRMGPRLPNGDPTNALSPFLQDGGEDVARIDGTCWVRADGTVRCFDATTNVPTPVTYYYGVAGAKKIAIGGFNAEHACAVLSSGDVKCWGDNLYGEVGDGTTTDRSMPVNTGTAAGVVDIVVGEDHSCAIIADGGTVQCWGRNQKGQIGDSTDAGRPTPVFVPSLSGVIALAAGKYFTCSLGADGMAYCWGDNTNGKLGVDGGPDRYSPTQVPNLSNTTALTAGDDHACALAADGVVRCWGINSYGQLGDGTYTGRTTPVAVSGLTTAKAIAAGRNHTCALIENGTLKCWGLNTGYQLGDGTPTTRNSPVTVVGIDAGEVSSVVAGYRQTCALLSNGTAKCWGNNSYGQLGDGTLSTRSTPTTVVTESGTGALSGIRAIAGGHSGDFHCAVMFDGTARCWGYNGQKNIGDGTNTQRPKPVRVLNFP